MAKINTSGGRAKSRFDFLDGTFIPKSLEETLAVQRDIWIKTLVKSLEDVDRVSSGALAQSIDVKIEDKETKFVFTLFMEDYWKAVDEGRMRGGKQPPMEAMLEFIKLRGIVPKIPKTVKPRKKALDKTKMRKSLAFAMAKSIKTKGIKPTNFYSDEIDGLTEDFTKAIAKGFAEGIDIKFN
jgi:hypothetical protein